jgi:hypothetical protein
MNRSILIAVAAFALGAPLAPAASAREGYRDEYRDRGEHRHRGGGGDDYNGRGEYHRPREARFVVHYRLSGGHGQVQAKSHDRAHRIAEFLESVGADARVGPGRVVYYRLRGEGEIARHSHEDAHRLAQKLQGYGFRAHVDHE